MKNIIIGILTALLILVCIDYYFITKELNNITGSRKELRRISIEQCEKALTYQLISIELSNLCDKYQSSRNAKNKNKKYFKLLEKIN